MLFRSSLSLSLSLSFSLARSLARSLSRVFSFFPIYRFQTHCLGACHGTKRTVSSLSGWASSLCGERRAGFGKEGAARPAAQLWPGVPRPATSGRATRVPAWLEPRARPGLHRDRLSHYLPPSLPPSLSLSHSVSLSLSHSFPLLSLSLSFSLSIPPTLSAPFSRASRQYTFGPNQSHRTPLRTSAHLSAITCRAV